MIPLSALAELGGLFIDGDWVESKDQDPHGEVRLIQLADVGDGNWLDKSKRFLTMEKAKHLGCTFLQPGDLLIARMPDPIGRACIFPGSNQPCVTVVDICILRTRNGIDANWLKHQINASKFRASIKRFTNGTTRARIARSNLGGLPISVPSLQEQKRIAAILDKADAIRRKREQAIQLADEFLRSLFLDMFGDPVRNPKGWPVLTFRQVLFEIEAGSSVNGEQRTINPGEKAVLKISAVTRGSFDPLEIKVVASADVPSKPITPNNGDLLFSRANTRELVAATCIVDGDHPNIFLPDKLWRLSVNKHLVTPEYLHFMLSHDRYRKRLTKVATGTSGSMLNISQAKLLSHLLPVPLMTLQKCFSEIVVSRAVLNRRVRSMHAEGKFLLSALSHEAFRSTLIL